MAGLGIDRTDPGAIQCPECKADVVAVLELRGTALAMEGDKIEDTAYIAIESNVIALEGCEHAEAWEPE